ncbi:MAG TPA: c-type cytochrome [Burkholderiales bacterium]|nr:c-type cytochrome [Burkholderiales bacterium]
MNIRLVLLSSGLVASLFVGTVSGAETTKADPAKGQQLAATCAACHGPDGNSTIAANPKIAGQNAGYLHKQLRNFKAEAGKAPERLSPIMNGMVAPLSPQDMADLAAYFASQKLKPEQARNKDVLALGQKIYRAGIPEKGVAACAGCHGARGEGIPAQYPRLSGQFTEYTIAQLQAFRSGTRTNDMNKMMRSIAVKLSDEEMKAVAEYATGLR